MTPEAEQNAMQEVRDLIAFYDARGKNWLCAAEFTLGLRSGELDRRQHWLNDFILIRRRRGKKKP